jgi:hypothetical protein
MKNSKEKSAQECTRVPTNHVLGRCLLFDSGTAHTDGIGV